MGNVTRKAAVQNGKSKAATLVDEAIQTNPVVIFSKTYCPYCQSAKSNIRSALKKIANAPKPEIFELDRMGSLGYQIQNYLAQVTGRHTVPNVFIGGSSVGGGDDIAAYARRGVLVQMLTQAPQRLVHQFPERFEPEKKPDTAAEAVERAIKDNAVMVFSKSYCPFCTSAKDLLQERIAAVEGLNPINVFELDEMGTDGAAMQQYLFQKTGQRTVPNIFIAGKHVGGSDDVHGLDARNELIPMLTSAAASVSSPAATEVLSAEEEQTETDTALPADVVSEEKPKTETKEIVFGAGCFWGVELAFQRVAGVLKTEVGYSNGKMSRVTYDAICTGATGSAEVVRVWYDPSVLFLKQLLEVWESRHDPTSLNKQGNDQGTQYRSAIYYSDEEQAEEVRRWISEASTRHTKEIVTEVAAIKNYCAAEEYHQRYLEKKGQSAEKGSSASIRCYG
uniref:peptide-methionine (S)-S-oxide reductase n=1 Tax=Gracilaria gracilis TaxID=2777 RepID=Q9XHG1_GRAGA|nr:peptide methionine sulfoxide reductase [Gracilaria gracilis]